MWNATCKACCQDCDVIPCRLTPTHLHHRFVQLIHLVHLQRGAVPKICSEERQVKSSRKWEHPGIDEQSKHARQGGPSFACTGAPECRGGQ